jgi:hypothetical protein
MVISGTSTLLSGDDHLPYQPFQNVRVNGQTKNASQVLDRLEEIIPGNIVRCNAGAPNGETP